MPGESKGLNKGLLLKLVVTGMVALVLAILVLRGVDIKGLLHQTMDVVRKAGPVAFFAAMAVLPAIGFPMMAFCLTAGPAFGEQLGLGGILLGAAIAILVNIILTYWLARVAFRPLLERWLARLGYRIPVVDPADHWEVTILVRITPGPPFFVQSYLLGLAQIPFGKYIIPSFLAPMVNVTGIVIFGDAIAQGKAKWAVAGVSLVIAAFLALHVVRKHYAKRKQAPAELPRENE